MKLLRPFFTALLATMSARGAGVTEDEQMQLAGSVHVIFERKCNECHGSHLKKPDGKFGYVLDLQRMADNLDYIVRGKPAESDLFRMVRDEEMPPDDHPKTPPLTRGEKDLVRRWIAAGATSGLPATLPTLPEARPVATPGAAMTLSARERATRATITLNVKERPAGEVFAEVTRLSGVPVTYSRPANEPRLSIVMKKGTVVEALSYLALCGNFSLKFEAEAAIIGPNPPPAAPVQAK